MTDSITVMNNLVNRIVPASIEETIEYYDAISFFDRPSISFKALLLANMEKLDSDTNIIQWGVERSGKTRSYINHLLRIGRVIIDIENKAFEILRDFSYDKYLELLTLPKNDIPKFILSRGKKLIKMTRDELRGEVYQVLGKEPKTGKPKSDKYQPDLFGAIEVLSGYKDTDFEALADSKNFTMDKATKLVRSSIGMLDASLKYFEDNSCEDNDLLLEAAAALHMEAERMMKLRNNQAASLQAAG